MLLQILAGRGYWARFNYFARSGTTSTLVPLGEVWTSTPEACTLTPLSESTFTLTLGASTLTFGSDLRSQPSEATALSLNLHREFFDAILAGEKKIEYRDNTDYWRRRLLGRQYTEVHFRNGYATKAPFMRVEFKGVRKLGHGRGSKFAIRLGKILELKNHKSR
jgi:hypothetical protein